MTQIGPQALRTLSISACIESGSVHVVCDAQKIQPSGSLVGRSEQGWVLDEAASNLFQYVMTPESNEATLGLAPREFRAELAAFSSDGRFLRVGSQLYSLEESGDYVKFTTTGLPSDAQRRMRYIEEFAGRDTIVAVASRRAIIPLKKKAKSEDDGSDSDNESDTPSVVPEDEAYESWSECSTAEGDGIESDSGTSDNDLSDDESSSYPDEDEDEDTQESSTDSELEVAESDASSDNGSQGEESDVEDPATYGYAAFIAYDSDDDAHAPVQPSTRKSRRRLRRPARVDFPLSLDIISSSKHLFHFSQQTFSLLYDSPPVVHPTLPLVVWPLDGAEALFADCNTKSYFTHMFGKDDDDADPITVKCHFSACGKYLHLALVRSFFINELKDDVYLLRTQFSAEVLTYRLCTKKPTRSPPTLLHRVYAELGSLDSTVSGPPPCTFTWAPRELYVTASGGALTVHRIALFGTDASVPDDGASAGPVSPESTPSALSPDFLFFPGRDNVGARLVVGGGNVLEPA